MFKLILVSIRLWLFWLLLTTSIYILPLDLYAQKSLRPSSSNKELLQENRILRKKVKADKKFQKRIQKELKQQEDSLFQVLEKQLESSSTAKQIDSIINVINNLTETAKEELTNTAIYKNVEEEFTPQIEIFHEYKDKLNLLDADSSTLANEAKNLTKQELIKTEENQQVDEEFVPQLEIYSEHKDKLELLNADSTTIANEAKAIAIEELNKTHAVKDIKDDIAPYINSPYLKGIKLEDLDSMRVEDLQELRKQAFKNVEEHYVNKMLERQEFIQLKEQQAELEALKGLPEAYRKQFEAYKNGETIKNELLTKAVKEAQKMLAKHAPALNSAQADLAKLKKKYSSVPNSEDLSTATKRNSLKGKPLKSRLVLGGNFQVVTTNPVTIDISPVLGYRFNKDFHIAIGATYRARFSSADSTFIKTRYGQDELTYGYRAFANYRFWKAFFVHAEYEKMSKEFEVTGTDRFVRKWKPGALAGIGSEYTIKGTLKGNVSLLYNFLFDDKERVYQSPWVFRFGMNLALE